MLLSILLLIVGFFILVKGADFFVDNASTLARALGIPSLIIGLTIVAFGTSAPECAVSVIASFQGNSGIAIGNVVGSNICNLLLVLGFSALFGSLTCKRKIITRDYIYSLLSYVVLIIMTVGVFLHSGTNGYISRTDGCLLLCFLAIYVYALLQDARQSIKLSAQEKKEDEKIKFSFKNIILMLLGLAGVVGGGELVVNSATNVAHAIGISDSIIALTVVAIGTSLPELVTGVVAVRKGETDLAIGNVLGSNIFNIFLILGLSSIVNPLTYNFNTFINILIMLVSGLIVFFLTLKNMRIGRKKGIIMLSLYALYTVFLLVR